MRIKFVTDGMSSNKKKSMTMSQSKEEKKLESPLYHQKAPEDKITLDMSELKKMLDVAEK